LSFPSSFCICEYPDADDLNNVTKDLSQTKTHGKQKVKFFLRGMCLFQNADDDGFLF